MRGRRGVSYLVSSLLVGAIVAMAVGMVASGLMSYASGGAGFLTEAFRRQRSQILDRVTVVEVGWRSDGVTLTLYNYGFTDVTVTDAYVDGTRYQVSLTIAPRSRPVQLSLSFTPQPGRTYTFTLVTANGAVVKHVSKTP